MADDLAEGRLVECLPDVDREEVSLYATYLPGKAVAPRIRLAVDWIAKALTRGGMAASAA